MLMMVYIFLYIISAWLKPEGRYHLPIFAAGCHILYFNFSIHLRTNMHYIRVFDACDRVVRGARILLLHLARAENKILITLL